MCVVSLQVTFIQRRNAVRRILLLIDSLGIQRDTRKISVHALFIHILAVLNYLVFKLHVFLRVNVYLIHQIILPFIWNPRCYFISTLLTASVLLWRNKNGEGGCLAKLKRRRLFLSERYIIRDTIVFLPFLSFSGWRTQTSIITSSCRPHFIDLGAIKMQSLMACLPCSLLIGSPC